MNSSEKLKTPEMLTSYNYNPISTEPDFKIYPKYFQTRWIGLEYLRVL